MLLGPHREAHRCWSIQALCLLVLSADVASAQEKTDGGVAVYKRMDELELRDTGQGPRLTMPLQIAGSAGLKVAFIARADGGITTVPLNMFDGRAKDNTMPKADAWVDTSWRPILYHCDRFRYNTGALDSTIGSDIAYENLNFYGPPTPGNQGVLSIRNLVIYRGEDVEPPEAPSGLAATVEAGGVRLSWGAPRDNIGVAVYVISRATEKGRFVKIAETSVPSYMDTAPTAGANRYRVLAADFQNNLSSWSENVATQVGTSGPPARPTDYEADRLGYASEIRRIHASGRGKVVKGRALEFGDSLSGALLYQLFAEAAFGRYTVEPRGRAGWTSRQGTTVIAQDLDEINPEFCLILYGTNNDKSRGALGGAMDDLVAIARACAQHGAVPIVATIPPRGFTDPQSQPEADYNAALIKTCREKRIPIAYIFEELQQQPDRRKFLDTDGVHWRGDAFTLTAKVWKQAMEQVTFVLLDRPD